MTDEALMNQAKAIIAKFGSQSRLAELLKTNQSTVQYWSKKGTVPAKWHRPILVAATRHGVSLSPSDFVALPEPANGAAVSAPEAKWSGSLVVGDTELPVYVLSDGRRVLTRSGAMNFLTGGTSGGTLESYLESQALQDFLPGDLPEQLFDVVIRQVGDEDAKAMTASAFIDICRAYSRARDTGRLTSASQAAIAVRSSMLLAAFAKTGIESAIDEVTGYQYERAHDALHPKRKLFLEEAMRPWEKTFPDELWIQFGRLTHWRGTIHERPGYWGKLVLELVFGYLDPDVCEWLGRHAPEPKRGRNDHQWLSEQYGLQKLVAHVWMLVGMATACKTMPELRQSMAERFGRHRVQFSLYLPPIP